MSTEIAKPINNLLNNDLVKERFKKILGEKAQGFISSVLNIVNNNDYLSKADPQSILNSAVVAATLDLPIDPNLGFAAIIPYGGKAQFQMMYKGFVQLAQRTGLYKNINVAEIYEGELISEDRITGAIEVDYKEKKSDKVIGYVAYFALVNGFEKMIYWPIDKIDKHGKRFSKSYNRKDGLWQTDFDSMAKKTMLKMILSKYGPMAISIQKAVKFDQSVVNDAETEDIDYIDNPQEETTVEPVKGTLFESKEEGGNDSE